MNDNERMNYWYRRALAAESQLDRIVKTVEKYEQTPDDYGEVWIHPEDIWLAMYGTTERPTK